MNKESEPQRLLFIISCYSASNTGRGGHYHSLRELSEHLSKAWPTTSIALLAIGDNFPAALSSSKLDITYISFADRPLRGFIEDTLHFGDQFEPTHIHSFDNKSHFFGRWIGRRHRSKVFLTKPGGPDPGIFFPFSPAVVCFSRENMENLQTRRKLSTSDIRLIPQRVSAPEPDLERIERLRDTIAPGPILLRICRIGHYYEKSLFQTLRLAKMIRAHGHSVSTVIIGTPEDVDVVEKIRVFADANDHVITDPAYTADAAQLVAIAHAVVGTGRGLMEAALSGKILYTPLAGSELPIAVTTQNWRKLAVTNFSERNSSSIDIAASPDGLLEAFHNSNPTVATVVAHEYGIESAVPSYRDLYARAQSAPSHIFDWFVHSLVVLIPYIRSRINRLPL